MAFAYAFILSANTAVIRSSLVGKRRNMVATPTPERRATSFIDASSPCSAKTSRAASSSRARLRSASTRSAFSQSVFFATRPA